MHNRGGIWFNSLAWLAFGSLAHAAQTVVANYGSNSLVIVDLVTGNRTEISSALIGTGPTLLKPVGMAREANGNLIAGQEVSPSSIFRIDPVSGNRTILSSSSVGTGPGLTYVYGLALEANGDILASVSNSAAIYRINPVTGDRTVVTSASVGSGATMRNPFGLLVETDGSIVFVPWNSANEVIKVNPNTGARTVISSATVGTGPALQAPPGIVPLSDGSYAVLNNSSSDYILRVDPATGNRTVISSSTVGTGPTIALRYSLAVDSGGTLYVADFGNNVVVRVDPVSGNRTVISSPSVGTGSAYNYPLGMLSGAVASISGTVPTVTTTAAANIAGSSATLAGNVTAAGTSSVTARGVIWSVTTANAAPIIGGSGVANVVIGSGTGVFSQSVSGLPASAGISFRAYATNGDGTAYGSVLTFTTASAVFIPGAPTSVTATLGNGQAIVSFTAPASNGSPITSYTVTASPGGATATGSGSPLTVTGLTNGTAYTFTVSATNGVGTGAGSSPSPAVTPATVPSAASGVGAVPGNGQAAVSFTAPASNGGAAITAYTVTASPGGATVTGSGSPLTVSGLANGTAYTFVVTATNAVGISPGSAPSAAVTPATIPGPATAAVAVLGNGQAVVSFTAPLSSGGAPISSYTVTASPGGANVTGTSSPLVVTGLANGTTYSFTVTATNAVGTSMASSPTNPVTPATVPGAPTAVVASLEEGRSVISFTAPLSAGGSAITSYTVTASPGGGTVTGTGSPLVITGLTNGTAYTFRVTATNAIGTSVASAPSGAITLPRPVANIVFSDLRHVYDGTLKQALVTVSPNVPVEVTYSATPINAAAYIVTAVVTAGTHTGSAISTLVVTKAPQTVALGGTGTPVLGAPFALTASASSGLPVTVALVSGNARISGTSLTLTDANAVTVRATQAGNENYAAASTDRSFSVSTAAQVQQTIAFTRPADRLRTASPFALEATASSGLPITYAVRSGPGTVAGNIVTLSGAAGQLIVRASQAGDLTYAAAPDVDVSFAITAPPLALYFGPIVAGNSSAKAGDMAATLQPDTHRGTLLVVVPSFGINLAFDYTTNAGGSFVELAVVDVPAGAATADAPSREAAPVTLTIRGQLVNGRLNGVIEPLGLTFSTNALPSAGVSANVAGFYTSSNLATTTGATYSIIGTNNEVLVVAKTAHIATGGRTSLAPDGSFAVQGATALGMATIKGSVDAPTTSVTGTIAIPGQTTTSFAGLASAIARTDRLLNLSSRARAGVGDRVLITGFVVGGTQPKPVLVRAVGPGLAGFGIAGGVPNPRIRLFGSNGNLLAENDDWGTAANASAVAAAAAQVGAFSLLSNSTDAALLTTLSPGAYSAHILDGGGTGVALAEIYDVTLSSQSGYQPLLNISTRGEAGTGENILIGGFVVVGNSPKRVLIRGVGPGLAAFGVSNTLVDPRVRVFSGAQLIGENDNWAAVDTTAMEAARSTGAFALGANSKDAALILTLTPGSYTAQVSATDGTSSGVALVEIYELP